MPIFAFEKSVGAVVFRLDGKVPRFLLLQYPGGHWGFIKGHTEKGEASMETLKREAKEETGIVDLEIFPGFFASEMYYYQAKREEAQKRKVAKRGTRVFKKVIYHLAKTNQAEITLSHEHKDFVWLAYPEALERVTNKNSKKVFEKAGRFLAKHLPNVKFQVK